MPIRIEGRNANPDCPLCKTPFEKVPYKGKWWYICNLCEIFIDVKDPCVHVWDYYKPAEEKEILCPAKDCDEPMNFFFRSDGFMKSMCPRCKSAVELSEELPLPKGLIKAREEQERRGRDG